MHGAGRFTTNETRIAHREELKQILEDRLRQRGKTEWTELFIGVGLPAGPIHTLDEVFADAQVRHCNLVETLDHPVLGPLRQVVTPVSSVTEAGPAPRAASLPPPLLGGHTVAIMEEAGLPFELIRSLHGAGVVHQAGGFPETAPQQRVG